MPEDTIIFYTIIHRRTLSSILDTQTRKLIKKCKKLCQELLSMNRSDRNRFIQKLERYTDLKNMLTARGLSELLPQLSILYPKVAKKQKYHHKKIEVKQKEEVPTDKLLSENRKLLSKLRNMNVRDAFPHMREFDRYYQVLIQLKYRGVQNFDKIRYPGEHRMREKIIIMLGGKCAHCGTTHKLTLHHLVPKSKAGAEDITNLQCLCRNCHDVVHGIQRKNPIMIEMFRKAGVQVEA